MVYSYATDSPLSVSFRSLCLFVSLIVTDAGQWDQNRQKVGIQDTDMSFIAARASLLRLRGSGSSDQRLNERHISTLKQPRSFQVQGALISVWRPSSFETSYLAFQNIAIHSSRKSPSRLQRLDTVREHFQQYSNKAPLETLGSCVVLAANCLRLKDGPTNQPTTCDANRRYGIATQPSFAPS